MTYFNYLEVKTKLLMMSITIYEFALFINIFKIKLTKNITTILIITLSLTCSAKNEEIIKSSNEKKSAIKLYRIENIEKNDLTKDKLKGKVKSYKEISYEAKDHFGNIEKGKRKRRLDYEDDFQKKYDQYGNLIEYNGYNSDGSLKYKSIFKYEENNKRIEDNTYNPDGSLVRRDIYRYSKTGMRTIERSTSYAKKPYNSMISKYEKNGNQIEVKYYNQDGIERIFITYLYDEYGNMIEEKRFDVFNGVLSFSSHLTYKYDKQGNQIEYNTYDSDNNLASKVKSKYDKNKIIEEEFSDGEKRIYIYDDKGNQIEMTQDLNNFGLGFVKFMYTYDIYGNVIREEQSQSNNEDYKVWNFANTYEYVYDDNGNWIKKIEFIRGKAESIIEREFEYYK